MAVAGKYDYVSSDKYEDYLKACGVGLMTRKVASNVKASLEFVDHGDNKWTQKTSSTFKNFEISFTLGVPFVEQTADGRSCDAVVTQEGNKLLHKQTINGEEGLVTREFKPDGELVCTFKAKDAVATRVYKRV